ncbi:MAG: hydantoinase/oxoprolinase family protein [Bryobacteraceae bacterium]
MRIGVDAGGTFTDFLVLHGDGRLESFKIRSNPRDPAAVILAGIERAAGKGAAHVVHGSTVATNALLERKGARTAFVTTAGFEDLLRIARQNRRELYNLTPAAPEPLVPRELCAGVGERTWHDGGVAAQPSQERVARLARRLQRAGVQSVAICFLHSYGNAKNGRALAAQWLKNSFPTFPRPTTWHPKGPRIRTPPAVINAYVGPVMDNYLGRLERALRKAPADRHHAIQRRGARRRPGAATPSEPYCIGTAGGVIAAAGMARRSGFTRILGFDMGGTSTDVSLCDGEPALTLDAAVDGFPVRIPMLDIRTVGAGGGSIARVDQGGLLRVGPESAGADPGPACYGSGERATVTDAHVVLGRIAASQLLSGDMPIQPGRSAAAVAELAARLDLSIDAAAAGILRVANANMERAIRAVSLEKGHDPRAFTLVAFGGGGGLHACELASQLNIATVLVPRFAESLSALGMLLADSVRDYAAGVIGRAALEPAFRRLEARAKREAARGELFRFADLRYAGQSYELTVPFVSPDEAVEAFHREHERVYGYANPDRPVEVVTLRVRSRVTTAKPEFPPMPASGVAEPAFRRVFAGGRWRRRTPVYRRDGLPPTAVEGPALILDYGSTTLVAPGWSAHADGIGNLLLRPAGAAIHP